MLWGKGQKVVGVVRGKVGWLLTHFLMLGRGTRDRSPLVTFLSRDQEQTYAEVPLFQVPAATRSLSPWRKAGLKLSDRGGDSCPIARQVGRSQGFLREGW